MRQNVLNAVVFSLLYLFRITVISQILFQGTGRTFYILDPETPLPKY